MQINETQLFCDVAQHRSISKGAAMHGVTQSAASQRIKELERRLGVTLIDRRVRPLELTRAGEIFFEGSQDLLRRREGLERRVSQMRTSVEGRVRVDAIYSAGIGLLNDVRTAFEARYPKARVAIDYKHPDAVYDAVRHQQCDIGILAYPDKWQGVGWTLLRNELMAVICRPNHPLATRDQIKASELSDCTMIAFERDLRVGRRIGRYLKTHGATPTVTSVFDNVDTIKSAVAVTDHVAIVPSRTVRREVEAGHLAMIRLEPRLERPLGVIHHRGRTGAPALSRAAQALVDFLLEHAGPDVDLVAGSVRTATQLVGGVV